MTSQELKDLVLSSGAVTCGIATLHTVPSDRYESFLAANAHGDMHYLENHLHIRQDPTLLLHGAQTILVAAYNYYTPDHTSPDGLQWARYALGTDYHEVLRARLSPVAQAITQATGADTRICVDTAPLHERYWAQQAGIGVIGLNSALITPHGSWVLLASILTTHPFTPDTPATGTCIGCGRCLRQCPTRAINPDGTLIAARCLSYCTIEYRGPKNFDNGPHIYGCDICQQVCPHNRHAVPTDIPEFLPRPAILALTREDIAAMTQPQFSAIFTHSAVKRTKLAGLKRNL